jgi:hypothetical protein
MDAAWEDYHAARPGSLDRADAAHRYWYWQNNLKNAADNADFGDSVVLPAGAGVIVGTAACTTGVGCAALGGYSIGTGIRTLEGAQDMTGLQRTLAISEGLGQIGGGFLMGYSGAARYFESGPSLITDQLRLELPRSAPETIELVELEPGVWGRPTDQLQLALEFTRDVPRLPEPVRASVSSAPAADAIETPWRDPWTGKEAIQAPTPEAAELRQQISESRTVYRVGQYGLQNTFPAEPGVSMPKDTPLTWAPENPALMKPSEFATRYGFPLDAVDWIEIARLRENAMFVTRAAGPYGGNPGGALEVVVEPTQIESVIHTSR